MNQLNINDPNSEFNPSVVFPVYVPGINKPDNKNVNIRYALIVFDLNETLCKRYHRNNIAEPLAPGYTPIRNGYLYKRPYLSNLLEYIAKSNYWQMAVYTSMTEKNGDEIINELFGKYKQELVYIKYGTVEEYANGNKKNVNNIKQIYNIDNKVLLVDNSIDKVCENNPDDYYLIPTFVVNKYMQYDNALYTLLNYIKQIEILNMV